MVRKTEDFKQGLAEDQKRQTAEVYVRDQLTRKIVDSLIADDSEVKLHIDEALKDENLPSNRGGRRKDGNIRRGSGVTGWTQGEEVDNSRFHPAKRKQKKPHKDPDLVISTIVGDIAEAVDSQATSIENAVDAVGSWEDLEKKEEEDINPDLIG